MPTKVRSDDPSDAVLYFDSFTLVKGIDYFKRKKVIDWGACLDPRRKDKICVVGTVTGSRANKYVSTLYIANNQITATECTCPMEADCKHTAALCLDYLAKIKEEGRFLNGDDTEESKLNSQIINQLINERLKAEGKQPAEMQKQSLAVSAALKSGIHKLAGISKEPLYNADQSSLPAQERIGHRFDQHYKAQTELVYIIGNKGYGQEPSVETYSVSLRKDGSYGAEKKIRNDQLISNRPPSYVRDIDIQLARIKEQLIFKSFGYVRNVTQELLPQSQLFDMYLKRVLDTGRCHFKSSQNPALSYASPLPGRLAWKQQYDSRYKLQIVADSPEGKEITCFEWKYPWYLDGTHCGEIKLNLSEQAITTILDLPTVSEDEMPGLISLLFDLDLLEVIPVPDWAKSKLRLLKPKPQLNVRMIEKSRVLSVRKNFVNPDEVMSNNPLSNNSSSSNSSANNEENAVGKSVIEQARFETPLVEKPDHAAMSSLLTKLSELGFEKYSEADELLLRAANNSNWLKLDTTKIAELKELGFDISEEAEKSMAPIELGDSDLQLEMGGEDSWWFSLAMHLNVNGKRIPLLPVLTSALKELDIREKIAESVDKLNNNGKFLAVLPDGQLISLPFERIRSIVVTLQELLQREFLTDKRLKLDVSLLHMAELIENLKKNSVKLTGFERAFALTKNLKQLQDLPPAKTPKLFKTKLREYQSFGLSWLNFLAQEKLGGILADDMGLGKTIQMLAHICAQKESKAAQGPFLIVCPTSVLPNWLSEAKKFAPHLNVISFYGLDRGKNYEQLKDVDMVITTYSILHRDIDDLKFIDWHGIALDEAQAIKNSDTRVAEAAGKLKANYRFCMTGTPIQNHLGDLWSHFNFLLPGMLGDASSFRKYIRNPIEKNQDYTINKQLITRIRPFILRRTKEEVAKDLPEKTIIIQNIELDDDQRDLYETVRLTTTKQLREVIAEKGFKHSQIMILDALLKLRQVCCDPRLVKVSAAKKVKSSAKLDALIDMLVQLAEEKRKVLLFSQFTSMLEIIQEKLDAIKLPYLLLTGKTKDRATPIRQFQETDLPVFLISLKAGGTGLNLTAADTVIHYDPWWNPAVEDQATDRAHRIGQTKNVFVYKFIAQGTIEQRMLELQAKKKKIANCIYDKDGKLTPSFSEEDLELLLQPIG